MKKFCCNKFQFLNSGSKQMGLNVRVFKLSEKFVGNGKLNSNISVMLTDGYEGSIDSCQKRIVIQFCSFCGNALNYLQKDDSYVQEEVDLP
jgi:hypothetical protein